MEGWDHIHSHQVVLHLYGKGEGGDGNTNTEDKIFGKSFTIVSYASAHVSEITSRCNNFLQEVAARSISSPPELLCKATPNVGV